MKWRDPEDEHVAHKGKHKGNKKEALKSTSLGHTNARSGYTKCDTRSTKDDTSGGSHLREEVLMFFSARRS